MNSPEPITAVFDQSFRRLDANSRRLLTVVTNDQLYQKPREIDNSMAAFSCGEYVVRSAAMVEQTFGGITTRLWDDPFEWTLPEKLNSIDRIRHYLDEVEATRLNGFELITHDADLMQQLPAPEKLTSLAELLLNTLARAEHFQGRAFAVFQMISDVKLPRI